MSVFLTSMQKLDASFDTVHADMCFVFVIIYASQPEYHPFKCQEENLDFSCPCWFSAGTLHSSCAGLIGHSKFPLGEAVHLYECLFNVSMCMPCGRLVACPRCNPLIASACWMLKRAPTLHDLKHDKTCRGKKGAVKKFIVWYQMQSVKALLLSPSCFSPQIKPQLCN